MLLDTNKFLEILVEKWELFLNEINNENNENSFKPRLTELVLITSLLDQGNGKTDEPVIKKIISSLNPICESRIISNQERAMIKIITANLTD